MVLTLQSIYGVFDKRTDESIYKGSTEVHLFLRWGRHLCSAFNKDKCDRDLYQYMFNQGFEHFEPRLIEQLTGLTRDELREREQVHLDKGGMPRCNMRRAIGARRYRQRRVRKRKLDTAVDCSYCLLSRVSQPPIHYNQDREQPPD